MFNFRQDNTQKALAEKRKEEKKGARLETSTGISLVRFAQKQGVNASSARNATKQMHLYCTVRSYKTTFAHEVCDSYLEFFSKTLQRPRGDFEISLAFTA
jgi:hypothetical protein